MIRKSLFIVFAALIATVAPASETNRPPVPQWIWFTNKASSNQTSYFRKTITIKEAPAKAVLAVAADDEADVWINGTRHAGVKGWKNAAYADLSRNLRKPGSHVIAVRAKNETASAGFVARLEITYKKATDTIVTDSSWMASPDAQSGWEQPDFKLNANWKSAVKIAKLGDGPWGQTLKEPKATAAEDLTLLPGFKAELLRSSSGEGSWICMTVDHKGRLIISPQQSELPLLRMTVGKKGVEKVGQLEAPVRQAMGLLYAHNSLYANADGPQGVGLYRLIDANKNDRFETNEVHLLKNFKGVGEHGYHAVALGPDGHIYVMNGNHTKVPEGVSTNSPHRNYAEDLLLPRMWDAGGHAVGILAPGGHILRTDKDGKSWELLLAGFRNSYDFDFNPDGEIFTFDSDMEWDWGTPWYRPTRIYHAVVGAEFGWRSGSGKWPTYYPDSLPTTVDIGLGSPTGVKFGTKSRFPEKYQRALFALDWSYGRIVAVHLRPNGATYGGDFETFLRGKPLNVSDIEFGKDGAMYFITGGRNTQSGLYRVTYNGPKLKEPKQSNTQLALEKDAARLRDLRRQLERFHGVAHPDAVNFAWPHLQSAYRWIRYAARIAIESQPVAEWKDRALTEQNPDAALTALLALARVGGKETQPALLKALGRFPLDSLGEEQKLAKLRIIQLSFIRQGKPEPSLARLATEKLDRQYPAKSEALNRELSQLLIYLEAPGVIDKTMALIDKAPTQEEQLHYIFHLRKVKSGWTVEQRKKYFEWFDKKFSNTQHPPELIQWFADVGREYSDGASYSKFLVNIRKEAIETLSADEKVALGELATEKDEKKAAKPARERKFVKEWTMADIEPLLEQVSRKRNFESGKSAYTDAQCLACHRFGNEGGSIGPELTAASSKYSRRDLLEAILQPSKVVSDQYQNEIIFTSDGEDYSGRVIDETPDKLVIKTNPLTDDRKEIKKSDITRRQPSKLSPMPDGLANNLTKEEILDLLAYIESAGRAKAANFGN